jgi:hypothetical protein
MALVRSGNKSKIFEADTKNSVFDTEYKPGETCEYEGIYKCTGCGKEVTSQAGKQLPQNHHQHTPGREHSLAIVCLCSVRIENGRSSTNNPHVVFKPGGELNLVTVTMTEGSEENAHGKATKITASRQRRLFYICS